LPVNLPWSKRPLSDESARRHATNKSAKGLALVIDGINDPENLTECMSNVEHQTHPPNSVVLLVDKDQTNSELNSVVQKARTLGWHICEVDDRAPSARKNRAVETVLAGGADPMAFVFLESPDLLYAVYIEAIDPIFSHCPDVGFVSSWMRAETEDEPFIAHPCPAFPYQLLQNETVPATAIRTEAFLEAGRFRTGLESGFEQWDLITAIMASGWIGITYPELLSDRVRGRGGAVVEQRRMRRDILARYPDVVARDAQDLIHLLESRVFQSEARIGNVERSNFHIRRPRDIFGLTLEQKIRVVRKAIRNPKVAINFMVWHTKDSLRSIGSRLWGIFQGEK
jgi:hypothetical protein